MEIIRQASYELFSTKFWIKEILDIVAIVIIVSGRQKFLTLLGLVVCVVKSDIIQTLFSMQKLLNNERDVHGILTRTIN